MRDDPDSEDIVTSILRAISTRNPGMDLLEVEMAMRRQWGSRRPYIAKKPRRNTLSSAIRPPDVRR